MRSLGYNVEAFSSAADFLASPRLIETTCLVASPTKGLNSHASPD